MLYNVDMGRGKGSKKVTNGTQNAVENASTAQTTPNVLDAEKVEREYLDILNFERKQRNNLLGTFDGKEYKIADNIKEALIKTPKQFGEVDGNVVRASTRLGEFILNFRIDLEIDESFCKARLFIIEMESSFDESIKHETFLDEVLEVYSPQFRAHIFERWNIKRDESTIEKDETLRNLLHFQREEFLFSRELYDLLGQLYVVRILALLDRLGDKGAKIRLDFKLLLGKYFERGMDLSRDFATQKRLLDILLIKSGMLAEIAKDGEGATILKGYLTPIKNIRDKTFTTTVEAKKDKKPEKKEDKKSLSAKPKIKKPSPVNSPKTFVFDMKNYTPSTLEGSSTYVPRPPAPNRTSRPSERTRAPEGKTSPTPEPTATDDAAKALIESAILNAKKASENLNVLFGGTTIEKVGEEKSADPLSKSEGSKRMTATPFPVKELGK